LNLNITCILKELALLPHLLEIGIVATELRNIWLCCHPTLRIIGFIPFVRNIGFIPFVRNIV
jgi:hypothetical protein